MKWLGMMCADITPAATPAFQSPTCATNVDYIVISCSHSFLFLTFQVTLQVVQLLLVVPSIRKVCFQERGSHKMRGGYNAWLRQARWADAAVVACRGGAGPWLLVARLLVLPERCAVCNAFRVCTALMSRCKPYNLSRLELSNPKRRAPTANCRDESCHSSIEPTPARSMHQTRITWFAQHLHPARC